MTKAELVKAIAAQAGVSAANAQNVFDATLKVIENALVAGDKVVLPGFGSFSVLERAARTGINPATKQTIAIPAKKTAKFKAGSKLNAALN